MLNAVQFLSEYSGTGRKKTAYPLEKLLLLSILAGFLIGMGGVVSGTVTCALDNAAAARIVSGLLFPFGLIIVILTGAELFTGNCLIAVSVLEKRLPSWECCAISGLFIAATLSARRHWPRLVYTAGIFPFQTGRWRLRSYALHR